VVYSFNVLNSKFKMAAKHACARGWMCATIPASPHTHVCECTCLFCSYLWRNDTHAVFTW